MYSRHDIVYIRNGCRLLRWFSLAYCDGCRLLRWLRQDCPPKLGKTRMVRNYVAIELWRHDFVIKMCTNVNLRYPSRSYHQCFRLLPMSRVLLRRQEHYWHPYLKWNACFHFSFLSGQMRMLGMKTIENKATWIEKNRMFQPKNQP